MEQAERHSIHKKQNIGRRKILKGFAIGVPAVLVAGCGAGYAYYQSKLGLLQRDDGIPESTGSIDTADSSVQADSVAMEAETADLEEKESIAAEGEVFGSKDVFNLLMIGTDERSKNFSDNARGDTCMLLSLNKKTHGMQLVSFERGQGVPILDGVYAGQYDWLTHTFRYGGAELMMREIQECYKVDVTHYIRVNFNTFIAGITAVGGVDIDLTAAEAEYINQEQRHLSEPKVVTGRNHLDGQTALTYARCRHIDSDWHRISRQRTVVQAAMNQVKDLSVFELDAMLNTVLPLVMTNLTDTELSSLMLLAPGFQGITAEQMTMPESGTYGSMVGMGGRRMFAVDFAQNSAILQQALYGDGQ